MTKNDGTYTSWFLIVDTIAIGSTQVGRVRFQVDRQSRSGHARQGWDEILGSERVSITILDILFR